MTIPFVDQVNNNALCPIYNAFKTYQIVQDNDLKYSTEVIDDNERTQDYDLAISEAKQLMISGISEGSTNYCDKALETSSAIRLIGITIDRNYFSKKHESISDKSSINYMLNFHFSLCLILTNNNLSLFYPSGLKKTNKKPDDSRLASDTCTFTQDHELSSRTFFKPTGAILQLCLINLSIYFNERLEGDVEYNLKIYVCKNSAKFFEEIADAQINACKSAMFETGDYEADAGRMDFLDGVKCVSQFKIFTIPLNVD
ncbi:hypothetical protein BpHYR1_011618 [Brachionus plicatilis]|uniref:Uncharacterized protein n=1 Tax=Brachionus plicatilis TaxID=10195 RepID=A0A3M7QUW1_BRAPC|nr:hypothetical protein BpHYR1_011618 [Brachionus plicatilis]